jgi:hypothetical protein
MSLKRMHRIFKICVLRPSIFSGSEDKMELKTPIQI